MSPGSDGRSWLAATVRYAAVGLVLVAVTALGLSLLLDPSGARGVMVAGAVAWTVQVVAFGLLLRYRDGPTSFLVVWAGGTIVRMGAVVLGALLVVRIPALPAAPTLLALAGFFFGLLLLEPLFFGRGGTLDSREGQR